MTLGKLLDFIVSQFFIYKMEIIVLISRAIMRT